MKGDLFFIGDSPFANPCDIGEWLAALTSFTFLVNSRLTTGDFLGTSSSTTFLLLTSKRDPVLEFTGSLSSITIKPSSLSWDFWISRELRGGEGVLSCRFPTDVMLNPSSSWLGDKARFREHDLTAFSFSSRFSFPLQGVFLSSQYSSLMLVVISSPAMSSSSSSSDDCPSWFR